MAKGHCVPENIDLRIGFSLGVHPFFGLLLDFHCNHVGRGLFASWDATKVFLSQLPGMVRIKVSHQDGGEILRGVVDCEKIVGILLGNGGDIRWPANHRPMIRGRLPEERREFLGKLAQRGGISAHPAFLEHHVTLGVKLAEHGVEETFGFHPHPKLKFVGGNINKIGGHVLAGKGVHLGAASAFIDQVEFILDHQRALPGN